MKLSWRSHGALMEVPWSLRGGPVQRSRRSPWSLRGGPMEPSRWSHGGGADPHGLSLRVHRLHAHQSLATSWRPPAQSSWEVRNPNRPGPEASSWRSKSGIVEVLKKTQKTATPPPKKCTPPNRSKHIFRNFAKNKKDEVQLREARSQDLLTRFEKFLHQSTQNRELSTISTLPDFGK